MLPRCLALILLMEFPGWTLARGVSEPEPGADEEIIRAAHLSSEAPKELLDFFRRRTPDETTRRRATTLIAQLGSESFSLREEASAELAGMGVRGAGLLRAASRHADLEIRWRARQALAAIAHRDVSVEVLAAALRVLSRRKPAHTAEVLLAYLPYADEASIADEIEHVLTNVAQFDGAVNPVLVQALLDNVAIKRSAAGVALCRAKCREQLPAIRRLLRDDDPHVRQRVGLALVEAREKVAVPVLIDLLTELPPEDGERIEGILLQIAGTEAPAGNLDDETTRGKYRTAWTDWWKRNGETLDLARMDLSQRWLGYTLAVCFGANPRVGCVLEMDARGKTRWQMPGLMFPVDAQVIDERRVLVTEYRSGQVTERDHKGEVLRRFDVADFPLEARRLPNGNTFITTRTRVLELDRHGKEKWQTRGDDSGSIVAACPLPGGQVGVCYRTGKFFRVDRSGKVLASFRTGIMCRPYGTHIQGLPNGHILIPLYYDNKVVEYDGDGHEVWSADYPRPTSAQRLPNGRTLVAGYGSNTVAELDARGQEVKTTRCEGRLMCIQGR